MDIKTEVYDDLDFKDCQKILDIDPKLTVTSTGQSYEKERKSIDCPSVIAPHPYGYVRGFQVPGCEGNNINQVLRIHDHYRYRRNSSVTIILINPHKPEEPDQCCLPHNLVLGTL